MFNALASLGVLEDAAVADLFAGSGALGIEALSRGAASCTFVESDPAATAVIGGNLRSLGLESRTRVVSGRVESALATLRDVDIVLADPPYEYDRWIEFLKGLESVVGEHGLVVIESGAPVDPGSKTWTVVRSKRYGRTWVTFLERSGDDGRRS